MGQTKYGNSGTIISNMERKKAAEEALAAIKEALPEVKISYGIVKDILTLADEIAYFKPLQ